MATRRICTVLFLCALFAPVQAREQGVRITHAWARATPPGADVGAVYLTIDVDRDDTLLGAITEVARSVEMHEVRVEQGLMKMRPLTRLAVVSGIPLSFEPQGKHFMLVGLHAPLVAGTQFAFTLQFKQAGPVTVQVPVAKDGR